ncbi:MAG TPA: hypothetical protein VF377_12345 [Acidimicrobiia bacterium]|jgi:hypothetical protein
MTTTAPTRSGAGTSGDPRLGYAVSVAINVALLYAATNVLEWNVLPFLTRTWTEVLPWVAATLIASIVANVVYLFDDTRPIRAAGDLVTNLVSVAATFRLFAVFPFDFSRYAFDWAVVARVLLVLGMAGATIAAIVALVRLLVGGRGPA